MFFLSPLSAMAALRARLLLLAFCLTAALGLLLSPPNLEAQGDTLSAPLSQSLGEPVYSENSVTGPSSSFFQGSNTLLSPYLHSDISDPLAFLIESSSMSPYNLGNSLVGGGVEAYVENQVVVDAAVAARYSEYQDRRSLMSGTANRGSLAGRAAAVGGVLQGGRATTRTTATDSFSSLAMRAPFATGSSLLAGQQGTSSGSGNFVDSNAMVSALTSASAMNSMQPDTGSSYGALATGASATGMSASDGSSDQFGGSAGVSNGMLVPAPNSLATGPTPGSVFLDGTVAMSSPNGFEDSTKGTAGLPYEGQDSQISPLASTRVGLGPGPFAERSAEETSFLNPTLRMGASNDRQGGQAEAFSLSEATRKARMHAMIYNPQGTALPSPFQQRTIQREFLRNKNKQQHRASHYPALTAPSVTH